MRAGNVSSSIFWIIQNLSDVPEEDAWLGEKERVTLSRFQVPKRRNDWRLGRWTAKQAARGFLGELSPDRDEMEIVAGEDGAPELFLPGGSPAPVSISISHSNGRGFCALHSERQAIGCDLEMIERKPLDFFEDYFTPAEIAFCGRQSVEFYPAACYLVWCIKEACLKILREGLRRDTRSVQVEAVFPAEEGVWRGWTGHCMITSRNFQGWWKFDHRFVYALGSDRTNEKPVLLKASKV